MKAWLVSIQHNLLSNKIGGALSLYFFILLYYCSTGGHSVHNKLESE